MGSDIISVNIQVLCAILQSFLKYNFANFLPPPQPTFYPTTPLTRLTFHSVKRMWQTNRPHYGNSCCNSQHLSSAA